MARSERCFLFLLCLPSLLAAQTGSDWRVHEMTRPHPATIATPATVIVPPPVGAVVLFDGTTLRHWLGSDGKPARWALGKGYFEVRPGAGTATPVASLLPSDVLNALAAPVSDLPLRPTHEVARSSAA